MGQHLYSKTVHSLGYCLTVLNLDCKAASRFSVIPHGTPNPFPMTSWKTMKRTQENKEDHLAATTLE